ncbi:MAG: ACP S-malonyltransferase [Candidatus Izimaplasma sp.]|nr:ACP S-malonyltransferase [Candidatus Izimaplasma bacterium]
MKLGFMFTGQGSEVVDMGLDFVTEYDLVSNLFEQAKAILGYDPIEALKDKNTFKDTAKIQPLTFLFQVAIIELLKIHKIQSEVTFGLSLGEYSALYDAGVFDLNTGLRVLEKRGLYMQVAAQNNQGKMCAMIGLDKTTLKDIIEPLEDVVIANYNTPKQLVISGTEKGVKKAVEVATKNGVKRAIMLSTQGAFHSFLMDEAKTKFQSFIEPLQFNDPQKHLYVNVTGDLCKGDLKSNMINQITSPVLFYQIIEKLKDIDYLIEIGPKKVLCNMVKRINRKQKTLLIHDVTSFEQALEVLTNEK